MPEWKCCEHQNDRDLVGVDGIAIGLQEMSINDYNIDRMALRKRIFIVALLIAAIFVVDLVTPVGIVVWFLYAVPLLILSETKNKVYLLAVCLLCSFLILLVVYIRPAADRTAENLTNRGIGVFVAFIITFILIGKSHILGQLKERNKELVDAYRKLKDEVAQRRRTEEELSTSRSRFLAMVEYAAESIYLIALDGTITYTNPAFCALTGYSEKDLIGQKESVLLNPGDNIDYQSMWQHLRKGETWSGYMTSRKKDGTVFERHITVSPVKDSMDAIT